MQGITLSVDLHSSLRSLRQPVGVKFKNSSQRHEVIEFPPVPTKLCPFESSGYSSSA